MERCHQMSPQLRAGLSGSGRLWPGLHWLWPHPAPAHARPGAELCTAPASLHLGSLQALQEHAYEDGCRIILSTLQAVSAGATTVLEARLCCQCGKAQQLLLASREMDYCHSPQRSLATSLVMAPTTVTYALSQQRSHTPETQTGQVTALLATQKRSPGKAQQLALADAEVVACLGRQGIQAAQLPHGARQLHLPQHLPQLRVRVALPRVHVAPHAPREQHWILHIILYHHLAHVFTAIQTNSKQYSMGET